MHPLEETELMFGNPLFIKQILRKNSKVLIKVFSKVKNVSE